MYGLVSGSASPPIYHDAKYYPFGDGRSMFREGVLARLYDTRFRDEVEFALSSYTGRR